MRLFNKNMYIVFSELICICDIVCKKNFDLDNIVEKGNFYQVTSFISEDFKENMTKLDFIYTFQGPIATYTYNDSYYYIPGFDLVDPDKTMFAFHESLFIFHTGNLNEMKTFVNYFMDYLLNLQRPKCLIFYHDSLKNFKDHDEIHVIDALKFAWEHKFLDFTILFTSSLSIYYLNPFNEIFYRKELSDNKERNEIFPDKLINAYGHEVYAVEGWFDFNTTLILRPNRKINYRINHFFILHFAAKILNLKIVKKVVNSQLQQPLGKLEDDDVDFYTYKIWGTNWNIDIPADESGERIIAFVPIIPRPQNRGFFQMFLNVILISGIVTILLHGMSHFKATSELLKPFDLVRIFLGQSLSKVPSKILHRIVLLTIIVASVKITNDFLLDAFLLQFDVDEVPFESYKDLNSSQLKFYTDTPYFGGSAFGTDDEYLQDIGDRIVAVESLSDCWEMLAKWKNVSCITIPLDPEFEVLRHRAPDGSIASKVANPPFMFLPLEAYWFGRHSPYANKFLEVMRRVKQTELMYYPVLVSKDRDLLTAPETNIEPEDCVNTDHLLVIWSFGTFVSTFAFLLEWVAFKFEGVFDSVFS